MKLFNWEQTGLERVEQLLKTGSPDMEELRELLSCCNVAFVLEGINRLQSTLLCELKFSYVQQSQRYVAAGAADLELSFLKQADQLRVRQAVEKLYRLYEAMSEKKPDAPKGRPRPQDYRYGIPIEDARYLLPLSAKTNLSVAMEGSGLIPLFSRLLGAQYSGIWEELKTQLLEHLPRRLGELLLTVPPERPSGLVSEFYRPLLDQVTQDNRIAYLDGFSDLEQRVALGALTSTQQRTPSQVLADWGDEAPQKARGVIRRVMGYGHTSIAEQARTTFGMMCSLVTYHQQIRHRLPQLHREELSELITRPREFLVPPTVEASPFLEEYRRTVVQVRQLREELYAEYGFPVLVLLLNCDQIRLVLSANARMDCDMLSQRICRTAQWEIRQLSEQKYQALHRFSQQLYRNALPSCIYGACKEGAMSCGQMELMRKQYREE